MFTETSRNRLSKAHVDLITLATELENVFKDIQISCSTRSEAEQTKAFQGGFSKAKFGQSPHNFTPALAIDFVIVRGGKAIWTVSEYLKVVAKAKEVVKAPVELPEDDEDSSPF